jgi:hypothetical protein
MIATVLQQSQTGSLSRREVLIQSLPVVSSISKELSKRAFPGTAVLPLMSEQASGVVEAFATLIAFERCIHLRMSHCG